MSVRPVAETITRWTDLFSEQDQPLLSSVITGMQTDWSTKGWETTVVATLATVLMVTATGAAAQAPPYRRQRRDRLPDLVGLCG